MLNTIKKHSIFLAAFILCAMLFCYHRNINPQLNKTVDNYKSSSAINLSPETDEQRLSQILINNNYVHDRHEADFVADTIVARLKRGIKYSNIYDLQKRNLGQVPASVVEKEGIFTDKLLRSYEKLGLTDSLPLIDSLDTQFNLTQTNDAGTIVVHVYEEQNRGNILDKIRFPKKRKDCAGVPVRLMEYYVDSVEHADVVGFAKTDSNGRAVFRGLDRKRGYSVLPIKKGYEYGSSKGVVQGKFDKYKYFNRFWANDSVYEFNQQEHRIQMIDNAILKQIKADGTITVRTPSDYKEQVNIWFFVVLLGWFGLYFILVIRRKLNFSSSLIITAGMFLTGLCVIMMFAIQDPLTEELRGPHMAKMVLIGIALISALQWKRIDFVKSYQNRKGFGWISITLALMLTFLLFSPIGEEIGGMRVNLNLGFRFQPSEIVKYLILFFLAAFFSRKAQYIIDYSQPKQTRNWEKVKTLAWVISSMIILLIMYTLLGDMGPALVIGFTFVLLYSLVKSKDNYSFENLSKAEQKKRRFTCDFAMLIYGIVTFTILILIGFWIAGAIASLICAIVWFVGWIIFGKYYQKRNQFHETAFIFNILIFALIFFGQIAKHVPIAVIQDTAERFEQRTNMCTNPWGDLDVHPDKPDYPHGEEATPVMNTQIANGLWAMATGGLTGQGLGNGNPNFIPAFNTDMILASMAEQLGLLGLIVFVVALFLLLWGIVKIGYDVGNFFAFFFCMGVAIVTAVQFFIIAMGSCRMMPLTGIAVPFLSYGGVSMVVNLFALGVILSLSSNSKQRDLIDDENIVRRYGFARKNVGYAALGILVIIVVFGWSRYSLLTRNQTLIQPAFVLSKEGIPTIEYNPRIALLTKEMRMGNIYDRNGVILATSDKNKLLEHKSELIDCGLQMTDIDKIAKAQTKRYYPFAEHLFFMLGDQNTGLLFSYNESLPIGYMAEAQHLSLLRGFDNLHDKKGRATVTAKLISKKVKSSHRYLDNKTRDTVTIRLRDYHDLVPFLKSGIHSKKLRNHNKDVKDGEFDLYLTLDAKLQTDLQTRIEKRVQEKYSNNKLLRISVVVLDAQNGDLLTSANYPLPDYQRLQDEEELARDRGAKVAIYSDNNKNRHWRAYTDRDLGLTYQTMPGSTAKVMSAIAGFQKIGASAKKLTYLVTKEDIVERGSAEEPYKGKRYDRHIRNDFQEKRSPLVDKVDMWLAIVESSNCYFINLINENDCYEALCNIYEAAGIGIGNTTPYYLTNEYTKEQQKIFHRKIEINKREALKKYAKYKRDNIHTIMDAREWKWIWGQGYENYELLASPLNMARIVSAVANEGKMPITQYILDKGSKKFRKMRSTHTTKLFSAKSAKILKGYMLDESKNQGKRQSISVNLPNYVGGKTGTPERYHYYNYRGRSQRETLNDGWYVFFVEGDHCKDKHPLAVAVRMERGSGSGAAVHLTEDVILEALYANGYINH